MNYIEIKVQDRVGIMTVTRPEALNALNTEVLNDLDKAINEVEGNKDIDVVVLTGAGRSFVAGADISEMKDYRAIEGKSFSDMGNRVFMKLENLEKPVICAVNGFALGGGCELAMSCDIRLASEKAKFGQPEVGLGITPGFGGTQRLPRLIGTARAMELIFTARTISAVEAKEIGLVNAVYPPEQLMEKAIEMAMSITSQAQVAVRQSKRCIQKGSQTDISTGVSYEAESFGLCFSTADQKEGMNAFLEKRTEKNFVGE